MLKLIAFDFDGTIIDTETLWYEVFAELYRAHGIELTVDEFLVCVGSDNDDFIYDRLIRAASKSGKELTRKSIFELARQAQRLKMDKATPRNGVRELIEKARHTVGHLCVVSSSGREWVEGHLKDYGLLRYFDDLFTRERVSEVKPDPELYNLAKNHFACASNESLAFEDSYNGVLSARGAGFVTVAVPNGITVRSSFATASRIYMGFDEIDLDELRRDFFDGNT